MRRRHFIAGLGAAALARPRVGRAEATPLVAILWPSAPEIEADFLAAFRSGLRDLGYVERQDYALAMRYANGEPERLAPLAAELAALNPRVIATATDSAAHAAHDAAPAVPLVAQFIGDPVKTGFAQSFARPGGTATGVVSSGGAKEMVGKRLELLKELLPGLARVGFLIDPDIPEDGLQEGGARAAAGPLGLDVVMLQARGPDDLDAALGRGSREGVGAFMVSASILFMNNRQKLGALVERARMPAIAVYREFALAGFLMSYNSDVREMWRREAAYVAKILGGAKPGDLPIEQPEKYDFVINLKAAKALGIAVPPQLLARADEVIE